MQQSTISANWYSTTPGRRQNGYRWDHSVAEPLLPLAIRRQTTTSDQRWQLQKPKNGLHTLFWHTTWQLVAHVLAANDIARRSWKGRSRFQGPLSWSLHEGRVKSVSRTTALLKPGGVLEGQKTISWTLYPTSWKGKPFPGPLRYLTSVEGRTISGATAHRIGRAEPFPGVTIHPSCKTCDCLHCSGHGSYRTKLALAPRRGTLVRV